MHHLIFRLFQRRQNHNQLLRKSLQARNQPVQHLLLVALFQLLMHRMRSFFHPFLNSLISESYLRFVWITFAYMECKHKHWLNHNSCFVTFYSLLQSSAPVELTEAETEYSVNVVKHIYDGHVVLQYNCTNTIPEQLLEQVCHFFHM